MPDNIFYGNSIRDSLDKMAHTINASTVDLYATVVNCSPPFLIVVGDLEPH